GEAAVITRSRGRDAADAGPQRGRADARPPGRGDAEPRRTRAPRRDAAAAHDPAGRHVLRAVHVHHRSPAARAWLRGQWLVLPRSLRGLALAPVQPAGGGREDLGGGAPPGPGVHLRQALLVV